MLYLFEDPHGGRYYRAFPMDQRLQVEEEARQAGVKCWFLERIDLTLPAQPAKGPGILKRVITRLSRGRGRAS